MTAINSMAGMRNIVGRWAVGGCIDVEAAGTKHFYWNQFRRNTKVVIPRKFSNYA